MAKGLGLAVPEDERDAEENGGRFLRDGCSGQCSFQPRGRVLGVGTYWCQYAA